MSKPLRVEDLADAASPFPQISKGTVAYDLQMPHGRPVLAAGARKQRDGLAGRRRHHHRARHVDSPCEELPGRQGLLQGRCGCGDDSAESLHPGLPETPRTVHLAPHSQLLLEVFCPPRTFFVAARHASRR
eukprot:scaffold53_cov193-Pinguiococcus_pyrenoidosus.AAC.25